MNNATFCDLFCAAYKCPPEEFAERVLWHCLFPHARAPARLIWRLNRDYFAPDLELIEQVRDLTNPTDLRAELNDHQYHHPATGLLRKVLKARPSGQRLLNLANGLFAAVQRHTGTNEPTLLI